MVDASMDRVTGTFRNGGIGQWLLTSLFEILEPRRPPTSVIISSKANLVVIMVIKDITSSLTVPPTPCSTYCL